MRVVLLILLPMVAPTFAYFAYRAFVVGTMGRRSAPREPMFGSGKPVPWVWLLGAGLALTVLSLVVLTEFDRAPPDSATDTMRPAEVQ